MGGSEFIGLGSALVENHAQGNRDPIIRSDLGLGMYMGPNSDQSDLVLSFVVGLLSLV